MKLSSKISKLWSQRSELFRKRRLSLQNATDNTEEWHIHLSPAGVLSAFVAFVLMLFILILIFVAYTPILEFLPGYRTEANRSRENLVDNIIRLDSMERMMNDMLTYNNNIALIMEGKTPVVRVLSNSDSTKLSKTLIMPDAADSLLRLQMEGKGTYGLNQAGSRRSVREAIQMVAPIEGIITQRFDLQRESFGISIAAASNTQVAAVDKGTVVMTLWTPETGYLIEVQHAGDLISVYKNLSQSLVSKGQRVKSGEIIGVSNEARNNGNSALFEFELWGQGKPVDPEGYIVF
ncbi:MAG: M23 family metallopeptidase [Alistipes sp.]